MVLCARTHMPDLGDGVDYSTNWRSRDVCGVGSKLPIGHTVAMPDEHDDTTAFRGAEFTGVDFTGATFRDCDLRRVKIVDSWLVDVNVSGLIGDVVVNDVDVTAFVEAKLDRHHPERAQVREMQARTTTARCGTPSNASGPTRSPGATTARGRPTGAGR